MSPLRTAAFAIALALGVSGVAAATPLELRHESPAAPASGGSSAGWKLVGIAAVAGGVALWMRKKRRRGPAAIAESPTLRVVARTSIGARSELLVVDVGRQRVLIGATPSSIRHLVDVETAPAEEPAAPAELLNVGRRFHALLEGALAEKETAPEPEEAVEAQAKNLVVLRRRS